MKTYDVDFEAETLTELAGEIAAILVANGVDEDEVAARVRIAPSNLDTVPATGGWVLVSPSSMRQPRTDHFSIVDIMVDDVLTPHRQTVGWRELTATVTVYRDPDAQKWSAWLRAGLRSYDPDVVLRRTQTRGFIGTAVGLESNVDAPAPSPSINEVRRAFTVSVTIQVVTLTPVAPLETLVATSDLGGLTTTTEIALG